MTTPVAFSSYDWHKSNLDRDRFASWADQIAHMESLGYQLVPPDYHIPHWSRAKDAPLLYVDGRMGPRLMDAAFDRPACDIGYPLYFRLDPSPAV